MILCRHKVEQEKGGGGLKNSADISSVSIAPSVVLVAILLLVLIHLARIHVNRLLVVIGARLATRVVQLLVLRQLLLAAGA